jgi:hypothetical protein
MQEVRQGECADACHTCAAMHGGQGLAPGEYVGVMVQVVGVVIRGEHRCD